MVTPEPPVKVVKKAQTAAQTTAVRPAASRRGSEDAQQPPRGRPSASRKPARVNSGMAGSSRRDRQIVGGHRHRRRRHRLDHEQQRRRAPRATKIGPPTAVASDQQQPGTARRPALDISGDAPARDRRAGPAARPSGRAIPERPSTPDAGRSAPAPPASTSWPTQTGTPAAISTPPWRSIETSSSDAIGQSAVIPAATVPENTRPAGAIARAGTASSPAPAACSSRAASAAPRNPTHSVRCCTNGPTPGMPMPKKKRSSPFGDRQQPPSRPARRRRQRSSPAGAGDQEGSPAPAHRRRAPRRCDRRRRPGPSRRASPRQKRVDLAPPLASSALSTTVRPRSRMSSIGRLVVGRDLARRSRSPFAGRRRTALALLSDSRFHARRVMTLAPTTGPSGRWCM